MVNTNRHGGMVGAAKTQKELGKSASTGARGAPFRQTAQHPSGARAWAQLIAWPPYPTMIKYTHEYTCAQEAGQHGHGHGPGCVDHGDGCANLLTTWDDQSAIQGSQGKCYMQSIPNKLAVGGLDGLCCTLAGPSRRSLPFLNPQWNLRIPVSNPRHPEKEAPRD